MSIKSFSTKIGAFLIENSVVPMLIAIFVIMSFISDSFLTPSNIANMIRVAAILGIMALGTTFLMVYTGYDLSVGHNMAFVGIIAATLLPNFGVITSILIGVLAGILIGVINGTILALIKGRLGEAFIITLGMQSVVYGIAMAYSGSFDILVVPDPLFNFIGRGAIWGVPFPVILFIVIAGASHILLSYTSFGRKVYIIGGNREAARLVGIPTEKIRIIVFAISGFTAAVAGIALTSRVGSASSRIGIGVEFDVIAAVVVGGTSMFGGEGNIMKTVLGVILLSSINNTLNLLNVSSAYQLIAKGVVIIIAVSIDLLKKAREGK